MRGRFLLSGLLAGWVLVVAGEARAQPPWPIAVAAPNVGDIILL